jgi:hypothetical protein
VPEIVVVVDDPPVQGDEEIQLFELTEGDPLPEQV